MFRLRLIFPIPFYIVFISVLSAIPLDPSKPPLIPIPHFDKVVHFCIFAGFGVFLGRFLLLDARLKKMAPLIRWGLLIALTIFVAFVDELHQSFRPGRVMDVADGVADTLGACFGLFLYQKTILQFSLRDRNRKEQDGFTVYEVLILFAVILILNTLNYKDWLFRGVTDPFVFSTLKSILTLIEFLILGDRARCFFKMGVRFLNRRIDIWEELSLVIGFWSLFVTIQVVLERRFSLTMIFLSLAGILTPIFVESLRRQSPEIKIS